MHYDQICPQFDGFLNDMDSRCHGADHTGAVKRGVTAFYLIAAVVFRQLWMVCEDRINHLLNRHF